MAARSSRATTRRFPAFAPRTPAFPDLSFTEYVGLSTAALRPLSSVALVNGDFRPGIVTEQFVNFYFRDPRASFARLRAGGYDARTDAAADMYGIHFIHTDQLNGLVFTSSPARATPKRTSPSFSAKGGFSRAAAARRRSGSTTTRPG